MTEEEFPDSVYPTNCFGTFYLISAGVRDRLYRAFTQRGEKIFRIDDVFVTGILAKEAVTDKIYITNKTNFCCKNLSSSAVIS